MAHIGLPLSHSFLPLCLDYGLLWVVAATNFGLPLFQESLLLAIVDHSLGLPLSPVWSVACHFLIPLSVTLAYFGL